MGPTDSDDRGTRAPPQLSLCTGALPAGIPVFVEKLLRMPAPRLLVYAVLITAIACHRPPAPVEPAPDPANAVGDNSRNSLDWPGTYLGEVPALDGELVRTGLRLREDGTYRLETAVGDGEAETLTGRFAWEPDGGSIKLLDIDSTDRPIYYRVGESHLRQLDFVNQSIEGKRTDRYTLSKDTTGLAGTTWQLRSLEGQPVDLGKRQPTLNFNNLNGRLAGHAGCNRFTADIELAGAGNIDIPRPVATKMACPDLDTEQAFFEALEGTSSYEFAGDMLVLRDAAGADIATFTRRSGDGAQEP